MKRGNGTNLELQAKDGVRKQPRSETQIPFGNDKTETYVLLGSTEWKPYVS